MKPYKELQDYLQNKFSGLKLTQPLFFNEVPGLRFNLQDEQFELSGGVDYLIEVNKRVNKIFKTITDDEDNLILYYNCFTWKRRKIRKGNFLFKQLINPELVYQFRRSKDVEDKYWISDHSCQLIIMDKARNINFKNIFMSISNNDFYIKPRLDGELYIINKTKNSIFLMYDDRGCDLISYNIDLLKNYYVELTTLILEPNRAGIKERLEIMND
ncbi:DUF3885 domain-containing protein [uncultured Mucilaginibacter sp.]|uniref:DUF3885 domain-containing protein n=1 Tax=uncultured Mucilaginibacter sp. TaxID=797541 RepID=UPI00261F096F|nr:DUF3885 domain-containing protein [uncultured Mucilaginibacter sp.]